MAWGRCNPVHISLTLLNVKPCLFMHFWGIFGPGSKLPQKLELYCFVKIPALKYLMNIKTFGVSYVPDV